MKKILYFLSAIALVLLAGSCIKEQLTTFDADEVVAPHLGMQIMGKKSVTIKYTPAVFNRDFNTKMDTHYSVVMVAVNGKPVEKNISASIDNNTITIPYNTLSKAFMDLGYAEGTKVESYRLVLRASIQPSTYDSSVLSYVDSNCADLFYFDVTAPQGSPYPEYTDDSPWGVTGALSAYGINWDKDLQMWATSDGTKHVAKAVTLKAGD